MAKAKRNVKTHPKLRDEDYAGADFLPPDRDDQRDSAGDRTAEVVDVFAGDEVVTLAEETTEGAADSNATVQSTEPAVVQPTRGSRATVRAGDGDGDDDEFARRTRKRVAREQTRANRERALREQLQTQLTEERTARQEMQERLDRIERAQQEGASDADVKALEAKIAALGPQIQQAMAEADTKRAFELQTQLGDLQGQLAVLKYDLKQRQAQASRTSTRRADTGTTEVTAAAVVESEDAKSFAHDFKRANRHWWNRARFKEAREDAIAIDKEIMMEIQDGDLDMEAFSQDHAEELARRLHDSHPDLEIQDLDGVAYEFGDAEEQPMRDSRNTRQTGVKTPPTQSAQRNGRQTKTEVDLARTGKVTLTPQDFNTMRIFKMDPNDPVAKKYFAQERRRTLLSGGGR